MCAAFYVSQDDGRGDDAPPQTVLDSDIYAVHSGPLYDPEQGSLSVTSFDRDAGTVTYRASPAEGYQWGHWEDLDGDILSYSVSMAFDVLKDREARAVFEPIGSKWMDYGWMMPSFDGSTVTYSKQWISLEFSTDEYNASIADAAIQRSGSTELAVPVGLCTGSGVVAQIVDYLEYLTDGMTDLQRATAILCFVQDSITYEYDIDQFGKEEFWAAPYETLYSGYGDCEDTATLYVSIASAMGLRTGFVVFESNRLGTEGTGHMSAAVALTGGASVSGEGAATFDLHGTTWAYVETAYDPQEGTVRPLPGVLSTSYALSTGVFTEVLYDDGEWDYSGPTAIGTHARTSSIVIYGAYAADSDPPVVSLTVGDTFSYTPETNLPSTFACSGTGMSWLVLEDGTLHGTATAAGTYSVTITATTTEYVEQTATQSIILEVSPGEGGGESTLVYGSEGWEVLSSGSDHNGDGIDWTLVAAVLVVAVLAITLIWRRLR